MASFDLAFPPARYRSDRPGYNGTDLQTFFATFPDDEACLAHLFRVRFDADPICSRCGKRGRWQKHEWQKHYFHPCGGICSPMKGTLFAHTQVPLQLWFYAMLCFTNSAEGMTSSYLARHLGVSERTAFLMGHRIRTQMALIDRFATVGGEGQDVLVRIEKILRIVNQKDGSPNCAYLLVVADEKKAIISILQMPRRHRIKRLLDAVKANGSFCYTNCIFTYRSLNAHGQKNPLAHFEPQSSSCKPKQAFLAHGLMQYINLSFHDQFRGVSLENSWLYLKEYQFRYNRRNKSSQTFWNLISEFPNFEKTEIDLLRQKSLMVGLS
jgi:transposase